MAGELGFETGPYVNIASFCERALQETDGVLSLMRVTDQITVQTSGPEAPPEIPQGVVVSTTLVVVLKPGQARGNQKVRVVMENPDGSTQPGPEFSVAFTGGPNNGANIVMQTNLQVSSQGLYWADVFVNDRLVTRVPLEIIYGFQRQPQ